MSIDSHLLHTCTIQRATLTKDALNAEIRTWTTLSSGVRGRLVIKAQRVSDTAFAERPVITSHRWLIGPGVDVQQGDRLINIVDETGATDPGPFAIREVMKRRGRAVKHISLLLERTGQDGG